MGEEQENDSSTWLLLHAGAQGVQVALQGLDPGGHRGTDIKGERLGQ